MVLETREAEYGIDVATAEDVYRASLDLLNAEIEFPFSDRKAAYSRHRDEMGSMLGALNTPSGRLPPLDELLAIKRKRNRETAKFSAWVKEADGWLRNAE